MFDIFFKIHLEFFFGLHIFFYHKKENIKTKRDSSKQINNKYYSYTILIEQV